MTRKKKEHIHNSDLRALVIEHYLNGDFQREITRKASLNPGTVRSMLKDTKIRNVLGTSSVVVVNKRFQ